MEGNRGIETFEMNLSMSQLTTFVVFVISGDFQTLIKPEQLIISQFKITIMKPHPRPGLVYILVTSVFILFSIGCAHLVNISGNQLPKITIGAFPSVGGNIQQQNMNSGGIVNVDIGTNLSFSGNASNPGGVRNFSIEVTQGTNSLYTAVATNMPNSANKVHDPLIIIGTNGSGGAGNQAMMVNNIISPVQVKTSASNFATGVNSFTIIYAPVDPNQRGKDFQTRVTLRKQLGTNLYTADFPANPISGTITGLSNPGSIELILLKKGQSASNCSTNNNPSAWVIIGTGGQAFPNDLQALFGPSLSLPVTITACSNPSAGSSPDTIEVLVSYHIN